jgi:hypothetical protein
MEEVNVQSSKEVSAKKAAKLMSKFVKSRPETQDMEGMFTLKTSATHETAGALTSNKVVQLQFLGFAIAGLADEQMQAP